MKFILGLRQVPAVALMATAFVVLPFPSVAQSPNHTGELPVLVLVRHADKAAQPADDPPLTAAGAKRAQDLAAALRNAGVTAIITTQLRRTRETAQPLATAWSMSGSARLSPILQPMRGSRRRSSGNVPSTLKYWNRRCVASQV